MNAILPILYSFRRCPYAMRARLALVSSGIKSELREVVLKDKPEQLIALSAKATVPVMQTTTGDIIDESIDIMQWALMQHDPDDLFQSLNEEQRDQSWELIKQNDSTFKYYLDRYKYADRYPEFGEHYYRQHCEEFLQVLEQQLQHGGLIRQGWTFADLAILPFIRQFAFVDKNWFEQAPYPALQQWLNTFLESELFSRIMTKYPPWQPQQEITYFP